MMNSKALWQELINTITLEESREEVHSILCIVLEALAGLSKADIMANRPIEVTPALRDKLNEAVKRLNAHEPVQYVVGESHFFKRTFHVDRRVLIPRPETEELVMTVIERIRNKSQPRILDIGTGSGCIAITLALELPGAEVFATDISDDALAIAGSNGENINAKVTFIKHDILNDDIPIKNLDVIVSNPPYISLAEKVEMKKNVVDYEPSLALFVSQEDPLVFYKAMALRAKTALRPGGMLAWEINERFGQEICTVLDQHGYKNICLIKDIAGKERFAIGYSLNV